MDYYYKIKDIFDKWAKDYQKLPEGEKKDKMKEEMKKAVDQFYGTIQIESNDNDS
jgi:hypothetical protein